MRQRTFERYEQIVRVHIKPTLGRIKLKTLTPTHVRRLYREKLDAGLSPRTVQYVHVTLLPDLVSAWERCQAAKEELNRFLFEEAPEPHMPERFGSVEELIRYNQQRAAYEHERSKFIQQRKAFEEQYNEATGAVTTILPVGATVSFRVPEDLGRVGGYEGNRYDISNKETEEGPRISVTKKAG